MPPIRSTASKRCALLAVSISLDGEIMSSYSRYARKGLIYVAITDLFGRQSLFYTKCTKSNPYISCDVRLVSLNKYTSLAYSVSL